MKRQSKLEQLIENFPPLGVIRYEYRWRKNRQEPKLRWPVMNVHVQRADTTAMHLQANNIDYGDNAYTERLGKHNDGRRGTRQQFVCAVDHDDRIVARLTWKRGEAFTKFSKEVFQMVKPGDVSYLMWVTAVDWYEAPDKQREDMGMLFGTNRVGAEVDVIVYRRPQDMTFPELIEVAEREKKEREEAYLHPPTETPELAGVHQALREGCRMHAFSSGGGLRVVRLELNKELKGYGEHPHVEEALLHLDEDYLAGGRPYNEVYGKKYTHYLTGDTMSTSNLDYWVRRGSTFDVWQEGEEVVFQLEGLAELEHPKDVVKRSSEGRETIQWGWRGFMFETTPSQFPNGENCCSTRIIAKPKGVKEHRAWMWYMTKTGRGSNLWQAIQNAFAAPEVEINKD